jgi:hypothetical protein
MGYYIGTEDVNIFLDKKYFDDVYKKMCELNDFHELKRGGSFGANTDEVEGDRYPRNKWFSWMEYNYPEIYSDMNSILIALGFDIEYDKDGNLVGLGYHDKSGNEDYFFSCFAGFVKDGSFIAMKGEESDDYYRYLFRDGKMIFQKAEMILNYNEYEETYEFGQPSLADKDFAKWKANFKLEQEAVKSANT